MLFLGICSIARGQTSIYWFDSNYDGAVSSGVSKGSINVDVSALQPGVHTLHYLYKDERSGVPSSTYSKTFLVPDPKVKGNSAEYWFDQNYASRITTTEMGNITVDASGLKPGVHTLNYHQIYGTGRTSQTVPGQVDNPAYANGLVSSTYSYPFLVPEPQAIAAKGEYWYDNNYAGRKALDFPSKAVAIDLSGLASGLHAVHYQALTRSGLASSVYTKLFWIMPEPSMIKAYYYWVNDLTDQMQQVLLETPASNYKLTAQIDVPEVPIRMEKYHFEVFDGKPKMFAKNTLTIMFENSDGTSVRHEQDYVDYRVSKDVEAPLLNNGDKLTFDKPEGIVWYKVKANEGDSIAFKTSHPCTMHLFSSTGTELWTASGDKVLKMSGARADTDGEFYLALQDVSSNSKEVTLEYYWEEKKVFSAEDLITITKLMLSGKYDKIFDLNEDNIINVADIVLLVKILSEAQ